MGGSGSVPGWIERIEAFALEFPGAWVDTPWGDRVVKVGTKIFVFLSPPDSERPMITVKLPDSGDHGLSYTDAHPTGYGLGKHGWVTIPVDSVPEEEREVLLDFVEESYRTVAPKKLVKELDARNPHD
jgi:predicted DNA-binding protein (MmcQ/YjbR family)